MNRSAGFQHGAWVACSFAPCWKPALRSGSRVRFAAFRGPWILPLTVRPSPVHGAGLFAGEPFAAGARVIEYSGARITKAESRARGERENAFIFALDDRFDLDGAVGWNAARFINHSCEPNCDAELIDGRIWIVARQAIAAGEELSFNYGYGLEDFREHPCRCRAAGCVGFMVAEDFFPTLRRLRANGALLPATPAP